MPLPLGHTAIGLATYEITNTQASGWRRLGTLAFITVLSNLPDIDVLFGLLLTGNGDAFHRGPTHSLVFSAVAAFLASHAWKLCARIPRISFVSAFAIVVSHVVADFLFTTAPVSFLWPLETHWSNGVAGWSDVLSSIVFQGFQDAGLMAACAIFIILVRMVRSRSGRVGSHL
jgi:membrane-bound metal-dependent hydrolase YbcI (DUF457 family)